VIDINNFDSIRIGLASSKQIEAWSKGEVTKPETINYRTLKPERDGLFCERIFGPTKDWECYCGKYKRVRYKGIICERCGVEVTRAKVRRERMGHIRLAAPISHIWFFKGVPSRMGYLLDITPKELEKVLYFGGSYVIISVDEEKRAADLMMLDGKVQELKAKYDDYSEGRVAAIRKMREEVVKILAGELTSEEFHADAEPDDEFGFFNYFDVFETYRRIVVNSAEFGDEDKKQSLVKVDKLADDYIDRGLKAVDAAKQNVDKAWDQLKTIRPRDVVGDETLYLQMERMFSRDSGFEPESFGVYFQGGTGAEAVRALLNQIDLDAEAEELKETIHTAKGQRQARAVKRLKVVAAFQRSGNRPEWMVLDVVPVIPPELRPMVQLDGGRFATSDLNDLYRRVINRNNRLKRLLDLQAPDIIVNNEKRMLQEAVDALFDNGRRGRAVTGPGNRPLKSLSDMLKGKQGRFRQNLLGKRVDYSGRSVIVAGPHLKMHQCGLPKMMALELFKPFIMSRLVARKLVQNIKAAKKMVDSMVPEVWDILEEVIAEHPVLLNRAPTLHRLGIQAFEPILVEGKAIQIHPLVCAAFNADFDGDQMAVHLPLSWEAQAEARTLMLSTNNILSPASGKPIAVPTQDMVMGIYYLTYHLLDDELGEKTRADFPEPPPAFASLDEVTQAYEQRLLDQREVPAKRTEGLAAFTRSVIEVRLNDGRRVVTTMGRAIFNMHVEEGLRELLGDDFDEASFGFLNLTVNKRRLTAFIGDLVGTYGATKVARLLDVFKSVGFEYATRAAVTVSKNDVVIPPDKWEILERRENEAAQLMRNYMEGWLTDGERRAKTEDIWRDADIEITAATQRNFNPLNPIYMMATSGARGDIKQLRQLAGWRGLMANPKGEIIERPIKSSFIEGLSVLEFFVSTHGARKGLADTALRTADSGYLTRRLVDVCQDVTIHEDDCGTHETFPVSPWSRRRDINSALDGLFLAEDVRRQPEGSQPKVAKKAGGKKASAKKTAAAQPLVIAKGTQIGAAEKSDLRSVFGQAPNAKVRMKTSKTAKKAEEIPVWVHDVNENLWGRYLGAPIVDESTGEIIFGRDTLISDEVSAAIIEVLQRGSDSDPMVPVRGVIKCDCPLGVCQKCYGYSLANSAESEIGDAVGHIAAQSIGEPGTQLTMRTFHTGGVAGADITHGLPRVTELFEARKPKGVARISEVSGVVTVEISERTVTVTVTPDEGAAKSYLFSSQIQWDKTGLVQDGDWINEGDPLVPGPVYPADYLRHAGGTKLERYLVDEVQAVYRSQGVDINDKHIELIVRQMMKKVRIVTQGDTTFLPGALVDRFSLATENVRVVDEGGEPAEAEQVILGITKASLATESWLSAASFQETTKVLTDAAIEGRVDNLVGLKENVIIGKLIPAATGLRRYRSIEIESAWKAEAHEAAIEALGGFAPPMEESPL